MAAIAATTGAGTVQVLASFQAVTLGQQVAFASDQFVTPPDNGTAAGPNHLVELVNDSGTIWDKSGNLIKIFDLNAFFAVPSGYTFSDPRILFDKGSGRWFASGVAFIPPSYGSVIVIAVSTSSDPTGMWVQYSADNATNQTHDQPKIGVSDDKVVLSWNDFLNAQFFQGQSTWVFQKSQMVAGTSPVNGSALGPDSSRAAPVPAVQVSPGATEYVVYNNSDCSTLGCNQLAPTLGVVSITGTPLTGVSWNEADPGMAATSQPPNADQPAMPASVATNDDRLLTAVWQNGVLWTGANDACIPPNDTSTRACSRLMQVSTSGPTITQDFDIASTLGNLYYPALGVDGSNNMFVVYNISSSSQYVGLRITGELATSPPQTLAPAQTIRPGDATYDMNPCFGTTGASRWGDYASAAMDPQDPTSVWVAGEYAANGTTTAGDVGCAWGTFAGRLSFVASQPGPALSSISPTSGPAGGGNLVTFNGSGFVSGTTSFFFGANPATGVSCSSATQCQGIAPAGVAQVTVTATVGGQPASGSAVYSYIASLTSISPTSGGAAGGTLVTFNGTGFVAGSTSFFFGAKPAAGVSCSSAIRCQGTAPAGVGHVTVTATVSGQATSGSAIYTYIPSLTSISPTGGSPRGGTVVTIVGNGFDTAAGATQFFFGASQATRISCTSTTQCTAVTPAGPARTTVNVKVIVDGVAGSNQLSFRYTKR